MRATEKYMDADQPQRMLNLGADRGPSTSRRAAVVICLTVDGSWTPLWAQQLLKTATNREEIYQLKSNDTQPYVLTAPVRRLSFSIPPDFADALLAEIIQKYIVEWKVTQLDLSLGVCGSKTRKALDALISTCGFLNHIGFSVLPNDPIEDELAFRLLYLAIRKDHFISIRCGEIEPFSDEQAAKLIWAIGKTWFLKALHLPIGGFSSTHLDSIATMLENSGTCCLSSMSWSHRAQSSRLLETLEARNK